MTDTQRQRYERATQFLNAYNGDDPYLLDVKRQVLEDTPLSHRQLESVLRNARRAGFDPNSSTTPTAGPSDDDFEYDRSIPWRDRWNRLPASFRQELIRVHAGQQPVAVAHTGFFTIEADGTVRDADPRLLSTPTRHARRSDPQVLQRVLPHAAAVQLQQEPFHTRRIPARLPSMPPRTEGGIP
jgi:hypothetical protein